MGVSSLEPYRDEILVKLRTGVSQAQIRRDLHQDHGVKIGSSALSDFIRTATAVRIPEVFGIGSQTPRDAPEAPELLAAYAEGYATTQAALTALQSDSNSMHEQLGMVVEQLAALTEAVQGTPTPRRGAGETPPVLRIWVTAFLYCSPVWLVLWGVFLAVTKYHYGYELPF